MAREIRGYYLTHYERGIRSKLTEYADKSDVAVKNGSFKAILNGGLSEQAVTTLLWSLKHTWHAFSIRG